MGRNKMEKDFREKLNNREIVPSANAWDRLDAMLTVAEAQEHKKKDYGWLYIAASILGFLFIATIYFINIPELQDVKREEVVLENSPTEKRDTATTPAVTEEIMSVSNSESIAEVTVPKTSDEAKDNKQKKQTNSQFHETQKTQQLIASTTNPVEKSSIINQNQSPSEAQPNRLERNGKNQKTEQQSVAATVDELIANANAAQQPGSTKSNVKVNAKSLLSQVDGEVNLTFREKMLHKIGKNYQEVAEAVATRNLQQ